MNYLRPFEPRPRQRNAESGLVLVIMLGVLALILLGVVLQRRLATADLNRQAEMAEYGPEGRAGYERRHQGANRDAKLTKLRALCEPMMQELDADMHECMNGNQSACAPSGQGNHWIVHTKVFCLNNEASSMQECEKWRLETGKDFPDAIRKITCVPHLIQPPRCVLAQYECRPE